MTFCSSVWNHVCDSWQYQEPIYDVFSQLKAVKRDPENLRRCRSSCGKEISEEVCLAAVEQDGHTLSYVKNPPSNLSEKEIRRREIAFKRLRDEIETRPGVNWKNWRTEISPGELEWILK